jgi:hypothetical protein
MGYANPEQKISYNLGLMDVVANAGAFTYKGPKGKSGRLRDIMIAGQTLCTAVTTGPLFKVGTVGTPGAYASVAVGALAAGANIACSKDQPAALIAGIFLPADTDFQIQLVAPTGGAPAGKIVPEIIIDWF